MRVAAVRRLILRHAHRLPWPCLTLDSIAGCQRQQQGSQTASEDKAPRLLACSSQGSMTSGGPKSALYHLKIMDMVTSRAAWSISTSPAGEPQAISCIGLGGVSAVPPRTDLLVHKTPATQQQARGDGST